MLLVTITVTVYCFDQINALMEHNVMLKKHYKNLTDLLNGSV